MNTLKKLYLSISTVIQNIRFNIAILFINDPFMERIVLTPKQRALAALVNKLNKHELAVIHKSKGEATARLLKMYAEKYRVEIDL